MTTEHSIPENHEFYPEAKALFVSIVNMSSVLAHKAASDVITLVVNAYNSGRQVSGTLPGFSIPEVYWLADKDCPDRCDLLDLDKLASSLVDKSVPFPASLHFRMEASGGAFPQKKEGETEIEGRGLPNEEVLELLICYLLGGAYERSQPKIRAKYGSNPSVWPPEVQFFRHIRNGCFHKNHFNILPYQGNPQINPLNPPHWRAYTMPSDAAMNAQKTINGFFRIPHTLLFLDEIASFL